MRERVVSAFAILTLLSAHFLSVIYNGEIYMLSAVSYGNRFMALLGDVAPSFVVLFCYSGAVLIVYALAIAGVAILVFVAFGLSTILVIVGNRSKAVLICAFMAFYALGSVIFGGCFLVWANHGIGDRGADKLNLSPFFLIFPAIFLGIGCCYLWLQNERSSSNPNGLGERGKVRVRTGV
jgi:hypothetical protein